MGNIDKMGLCRGTKWHTGRNRPERCLRQAEHKHMTPEGFEYFLCDDCEETMVNLLDEGKSEAVNQFIFGGHRTTGVGYAFISRNIGGVSNSGGVSSHTPDRPKRVRKLKR